MGWLTADPAGLPADVQPKTPAQIARLAREAAALDADVVALQGIDPAAAAAVFPPDRYVLEVAGDDVRQHTGFAIRRGLAARRKPDLDALDVYPEARLHLRAGTEVAVGALDLLSVHLKSGCRDGALDTDRPACATLGQQLDALHDWASARTGPFVILGDFARVMDGDDPSLPRIGPGLVRAEAKLASPCAGGAPFVDHILLGGGAAAWLQPGSLRVMVSRDTGTGHCPVSLRLTLPEP